MKRQQGELLPMVKFREILRLHDLGYTQSDIARSCFIARSTVQDYLNRAKTHSLSYEQLVQLSDSAAQQLLGKGRSKSAQKDSSIDFKAVHAELQRKGVTLALLVAWKEILEDAPVETDEDHVGDGLEVEERQQTGTVFHHAALLVDELPVIFHRLARFDDVGHAADDARGGENWRGATQQAAVQCILAESELYLGAHIFEPAKRGRRTGVLHAEAGAERYEVLDVLHAPVADVGQRRRLGARCAAPMVD